MKLSVSFLSMSPPLKDNLIKLTNLDIDYLHLDIMDGVFVKNKTWHLKDMTFLPRTKPLDIHLMVKDVIRYIDEFKVLEPDFITFHYEIGNTKNIISYLKQCHIKVGIAINPLTDINEIVPYLKDIDLILVMSVTPGAGGQTFMEDSVARIAFLDNYRKHNNLNYLIEVDGGINNETIKKIPKVDIAVVGSYITNGDYLERINSLKERND